VTSPFAVAAIGDEGIVLDVGSGEIFRAEGAALVALRALARGGSIDAAAGEVARAFEVSKRAAAADLRALLARIPRTRARSRMFVATANGFAAGFGLAIDRRGRIVPRAPALRRVLAPHALALRGARILHASAVVLGGEVVGFLGPTGIGKTTIARTLAKTPLSADLLVLRNPSRVFIDGERRVHAFAAGKGSPRLGGATLPLRAIFVVARGPSLRVMPLRGARAISALFANAFVELPDARVWRRALATSRALAARGVVWRLVVPNGLKRTRAALRRWKIVSRTRARQ
jgi:hypothetical protein